MIRRTRLPRATKALKRTPLARGMKPIRAKREATRRVAVARDQPYMDWLKGRKCIVCWQSGFTVYSDPAHTGKTNGMRSKSDDRSCIPLCRLHHREMDGQLSTKITTKAAFAEKYGLDLVQEAAAHYALFKLVGECVG